VSGLKAGAIDAVVAAMRAHVGNAGLAQQACTTMRNMCFNNGALHASSLFDSQLLDLSVGRPLTVDNQKTAVRGGFVELWTTANLHLTLESIIQVLEVLLLLLLADASVPFLYCVCVCVCMCVCKASSARLNAAGDVCVC
jgi:hypothetical protein